MRFARFLKSALFGFVFVAAICCGFASVMISQNLSDKNVAEAEVVASSSTDVAYFNQGWITKVFKANSNITPDKIKAITFTDVAPTGTALCSVGSILDQERSELSGYDVCGESDYVASEGVADVLAYATADAEDSSLWNITFYAPGTIYAPTSCYYVFDLSNLESIDFNSAQFDTSKTRRMENMFDSNKLTSLDVRNFNTSNVTSMSGMFCCPVLEELDLSSFDTSKLVDMGSMFYGCYSLKKLDLTNFVTSNVYWMEGVFKGCSRLTELDISNFNTSNVRDMSQMFYGCKGLTELNLKHFDTSNVGKQVAGGTSIPDGMKDMFSGCSNLTSLDLTNFDTSNVNNMSGMFSGCSKLEKLSGLHSYNENVFNTKNVVDMGAMFKGCSSLDTLETTQFDFSSVVDMSEMFSGCDSLTKITFANVLDLSSPNLKNMSQMFKDCSSFITLLDLLECFDTKNVTNMSEIFYGCGNFTRLDMSSWDLGSLTEEGSKNLFGGCGKLEEIVLPKNIVTEIDLYPYDVFGNEKAFYNVSNGMLVEKLTSAVQSTAGETTTIAVGKPIIYDLPEGVENNPLNPQGLVLSSSQTEAQYSLYDPLRNGYKVVSWVVGGAASSEKTASVENNILTFDSAFYSLTLTPTFEKIQYKISYVTNTSTELEDEYYTIVENVTGNMNKHYTKSVSKGGYTFAGWDVAENAEGFKPTFYLGNGSNASYIVFAKGTYGDLVLTAKWTPNQYEIRLKTNNDQILDPLTYTVSESEQRIDLSGLQTLTKDHYTFSHWKIYYGANLIEDNKLVVESGDYGYIELEAVWDPVKYNISIDLNDGASAIDNTLKYDIEDGGRNIPIGLHIPTRAGYNFSGLQIITNSKGAQFVVDQKNILTVPEGAYGDIALRAVWEAIDYQITIAKNNGAGSETLTYNISDCEQRITLTPPAENGAHTLGHHFVGWSIASYNGTCPAQIDGNELILPANSYGEFEILANWAPNVYKVTLELNGGQTESETTFDVTYGKSYSYRSYNLSSDLPAPTKVGYTFDGWYFDEEFSNQVIDDTTVTALEDHKLYAKWIPVSKPFFNTVAGYIVLGATGLLAVGMLIGSIMGVVKIRKKKKMSNK